jgi:hypothetical protein
MDEIFTKERFDFLDTESADLRYVIAAHHLRDCDYVIEIGGRKMGDFLTHRPKVTLIIDPLFDEHLVRYYDSSSNITKVPEFYQDYNFTWILERPGTKGLVLLGFMLKRELTQKGKNDDLQKLRELFTHMDVVILDTMIRDTDGYKNFLEAVNLAEECGLTKVMERKIETIYDSSYQGDQADKVTKPRHYFLFRRNGE